MGHRHRPGRARDWVSALSDPVMPAITQRGLGSGQVSAPARPRACDSAPTEPGRRLSARRTPDPGLPRDPAGRAPPAPGALAPGPPARNLPRAMALPLALPASAAAHRTQGTQRAPSNGRLATEPLPPSRRRGHVTVGRGHVTVGRGRHRHPRGAWLAVCSFTGPQDPAPAAPTPATPLSRPGAGGFVPRTLQPPPNRDPVGALA